MSKSVLVIIPCFNEEQALPMVLQELQHLIMPTGYQLSILVVNDCSTDGTLLAVKPYQVDVLDLPINLGIGGAVQAGLRYADEQGFDMAIQLDGDGQHPPAEIIKLISGYEASDAHLVIGSRFLNRQGFQSSFLRRVGIRYFFQLNRALTGRPVYDSTSGFRLFSRKAIALAAKHYPDDYPEPESLVQFSRAGLSISEVPVVMRERKGGKSSIRNWGSLYYCFKVTLAITFSAVRKPV